ncbi:MAG: HI0074 family nucleotidyltransferase substrate-binding subunit [Clostridiales bacterium]|nr:HI0074 family nucleotidyltransferase substrate-binding subunit [Clostridiales bacterium]
MENKRSTETGREDSMDSSLTTIYRQIASIGHRLGAGQVVLYGSRARGDQRPRSDIDLAVFGAAPETYAPFLDALEELPTLLDFDLLYVTADTDPELVNNIKRDGVILMNKLQEKHGKLVQAIRRLEEGIADYDRLGLDSIRDGVIQRFAFCTELAWKTAREYLLDQSYTDLNSPKSVIRQAYADGLIQDEGGWLALLTARNQTSHIYEEATAQAVFLAMKTTYLPLLRALAGATKPD